MGLIKYVPEKLLYNLPTFIPGGSLPPWPEVSTASPSIGLASDERNLIFKKIVIIFIYSIIGKILENITSEIIIFP